MSEICLLNSNFSFSFSPPRSKQKLLTNSRIERKRSSVLLPILLLLENAAKCHGTTAVRTNFDLIRKIELVSAKSHTEKSIDDRHGAGTFLLEERKRSVLDNRHENKIAEESLSKIFVCAKFFIGVIVAVKFDLFGFRILKTPRSAR